MDPATLAMIASFISSQAGKPTPTFQAPNLTGSTGANKTTYNAPQSNTGALNAGFQALASKYGKSGS